MGVPRFNKPRRTASLQSVERVCDVLEAFTLDAPERSTVELAQVLGLPKGTVYRFVSTLVKRGYLEQDPASRRYRLGVRVLDLSRVLQQQLDVRKRALPYMEQLSRETNENVNLAIRAGTELIYLERIEGRQFLNLNLRVGSRLPLHSTSMGKVLLAFLPQPEQEELLAQLELAAFTPNTITDLEAFRAELARVAAQGYAISDQELASGLITVAAPVYGYTGDLVAALNVSGPSTRMTPKKVADVVVPALLRSAREVSRALGAPIEDQ